MNVHLQRGNLLYEQERFAAAEGEFRLAAAADPDAPEPHAMLALALVQQERWEDATTEARESVGLAPDWSFAHYVHAKVLYDRHRMKEARAAIAQAIELAPTDADAHTLLAAMHLDESRFADALRSAETALEHEPEHTGGNNLRAMALVKLGRRAEAGATIDSALARDPGNAVTHANQGWTLLESGERERALEHFREALRLDPDNDWARQGIIEAMKAKNPVYSVMLRYFFWMSRLTPRTQWMVILGGYFGNRALGVLSDANPSLDPIVTPLQFLYLTFVFLTWTAEPLSNLLLRLDRFGRLVLSPEQVRSSNWVGATLALALAAAAAALVTRDGAWVILAFGCAFMLIPISAIYKAAEGWPRRVLTIYTVVMALAGLTGFGMVYFVMLIGVSWVANALIQHRPTR